MEEEEAWQAVAATLYAEENIVALAPGKDIKRPTAAMPGYNPWVWVAFTESRYIEVSFATGNPTSYLLSAVERIELKRGVLGGRKLVVKATDAPDSAALEILHVPNEFAEIVKPLVDSRQEAPPLPDDFTRYERVTVPVTGGGIADIGGTQTIEFRCVLCRGYCGIETPGGHLAPEESTSTHVYERCTGCLRQVEAVSDAPAL